MEISSMPYANAVDQLFRSVSCVRHATSVEIANCWPDSGQAQPNSPESGPIPNPSHNKPNSGQSWSTRRQSGRISANLGHIRADLRASHFRIASNSGRIMPIRTECSAQNRPYSVRIRQNLVATPSEVGLMMADCREQPGGVHEPRPRTDMLLSPRKGLHRVAMRRRLDCSALFPLGLERERIGGRGPGTGTGVGVAAVDRCGG